MNRSFFSGLIASFTLLWAMPSLALTRTEIDDSTAMSTVPTVTVPGGHSVVVSFDNNRFIQSLWIDDPAILGATTNRPLCGQQAASNGCGFATAVRLTQLTGALDLPGTSFRQSNGLATLVSVSTTNAQGTDPRIYQFTVNTTGNTTSNTSLVSIVPSRDTTNASSTDTLQALRRPGRGRYNLSEIRSGHGTAITRGIADVESDAWLALEEFLIMTDEGISIAKAINDSGVPAALLTELERLGGETIGI
ncbi:MAG: hypothetical protein AAFV90_24195 [Cyanobacteria bacterium J06634_5]